MTFRTTLIVIQIKANMHSGVVWIPAYSQGGLLSLASTSRRAGERR
jgi:hypothetical protein